MVLTFLLLSVFLPCLVLMPPSLLITMSDPAQIPAWSLGLGAGRSFKLTMFPPAKLGTQTGTQITLLYSTPGVSARI